jgi:hypothetical protein
MLAVIPLVSAQQTGHYWFQVGADMSVATTGVAVDIRIVQQTPPADGSTLAFWVGIDLSNDAFFQVGYLSCCNDQRPSSFWTYFPSGKASEGTGGVSGGVAFLTLNTWVHFNLSSNGNIWTAFINNSPVESVNLGTSYGLDAYAIAEDADAHSPSNIMQPVEFKNFQYQDSSGWHSASPGRAISGFSLAASGATIYTGPFPYGIQSTVGVNNDWTVGSRFSLVYDGTVLWPWYNVTLDGASNWYLIGQKINMSSVPTVIKESPTSRQILAGWKVDGISTSQTCCFTAEGNMTLNPIYVQQYLIQVNSTLGNVTGSGWYNDGSWAMISVQPTSIPTSGILGELGVTSVFAGWMSDHRLIAFTVEVKAPMTITAVWRTNLGNLPYLVIVIALTVGLFITVQRFRSKDR